MLPWNSSTPSSFPACPCLHQPASLFPVVPDAFWRLAKPCQARRGEAVAAAVAAVRDHLSLPRLWEQRRRKRGGVGLRNTAGSSKQTHSEICLKNEMIYNRRHSVEHLSPSLSHPLSLLRAVNSPLLPPLLNVKLALPSAALVSSEIILRSRWPRL